MNIRSIKQHGSAHGFLALFLVVALVGVLGFVGYNAWKRQAANAGGEASLGRTDQGPTNSENGYVMLSGNEFVDLSTKKRITTDNYITWSDAPNGSSASAIKFSSSGSRIAYNFKSNDNNYSTMILKTSAGKKIGESAPISDQYVNGITWSKDDKYIGFTANKVNEDGSETRSYYVLDSTLRDPTPKLVKTLGYQDLPVFSKSDSDLLYKLSSSASLTEDGTRKETITVCSFTLSDLNNETCNDPYEHFSTKDDTLVSYVDKEMLPSGKNFIIRTQMYNGYSDPHGLAENVLYLDTSSKAITKLTTNTLSPGQTTKLRLVGVAPAPDGKSVLYVKDTGSNTNSEVTQMNLADGVTTVIGNAKDSKDSFYQAGWLTWQPYPTGTTRPPIPNELRPEFSVQATGLPAVLVHEKAYTPKLVITNKSKDTNAYSARVTFNKSGSSSASQTYTITTPMMNAGETKQIDLKTFTATSAPFPSSMKDGVSINAYTTVANRPLVQGQSSSIMADQPAPAFKLSGAKVRTVARNKVITIEGTAEKNRIVYLEAGNTTVTNKRTDANGKFSFSYKVTKKVTLGVGVYGFESQKIKVNIKN